MTRLVAESVEPRGLGTRDEHGRLARAVALAQTEARLGGDLPGGLACGSIGHEPRTGAALPRPRRRGESHCREQDERECPGRARRRRLHHAEDTARGAFTFRRLRYDGSLPFGQEAEDRWATPVRD